MPYTNLETGNRVERIRIHGTELEFIGEDRILCFSGYRVLALEYARAGIEKAANGI